MSQIYMTNVVWLTSLWNRTAELASTSHPSVEAILDGTTHAMMAVVLLDSLAYLQPARMRLSVATSAILAALRRVASSSQVA